ncbi:MAG: Holliday junction resolvase RuvX [Candidatus Omnitrophota bacterium]|nr:Holliday junction resolvase RuvX [Candidatus Omnitrophota bacterium]
MRILGLDFGTKRIGVAMSDELLLTAQGLETIRRKELKIDLSLIKDIIDSNGVSEVIVGLPLNMNGTYSEKTREAVFFAGELEKTISVPVKTWDERLSSMQADRAMLEGDMSRAKRRKLSDRLAAQIILQSYLDSRKRDKC